MGCDIQNRVLINEAVFLLQRLRPDILADAGHRFESLKGELMIGKLGGEEAGDSHLDAERGQIVLLALEVAQTRAGEGLVLLRRRIKKMRRIRLAAQVVALLSSSIAALSGILGKSLVSVSGACLAALASVGNLIVGTGEHAIADGSQNIYQCHEQTSSLKFKAALAAENIRLLLKYPANEELRQSITSANTLLEELNRWISSNPEGL